MTSIHGPQAMPVADAICQPGRMVLFPRLDPDDVEKPLVLPEGHWMPSRQFRDTELSQYKRVRVDHAPDPDSLVPLSQGGLFPDELQARVRDAVGPQRLPFDDMWFEGTPSLLGGSGVDGVVALAVRVRHRFLSDSEPTVNTFTLFGLEHAGTVQQLPVRVAVFVNPDGTIYRLGGSGIDAGQRTVPVDKCPKHFFGNALDAAIPVMWAIGMMNCKNVKTQEVQRVPTKTKKQRRARYPGLDYHTIVLPGAAGGSEGDGRGAGMTRLHTVRGHFATYTPEAPLFGKLVGTYWKPWHLSGNPDRGVVESDYRLDA